MEESRPRFEEGIAAVKRLWTEERVTFEGRFHRFKDVTLLPRPVQKPHPPILVAAIATPESFIWAGEQGYGLMFVPYLSDFDDLAEKLSCIATLTGPRHMAESRLLRPWPCICTWRSQPRAPDVKPNPMSSSTWPSFRRVPRPGLDASRANIVAMS